MPFRFQEDEERFSLKAYALSKGQHVHMSEVTAWKFEHGENVTDTHTGKHGQVHLRVWDGKLETWRYCISRKDVDDEDKYVVESHLVRAPAQTRIDTGKTMLYAPRRLRGQDRCRSGSFPRRPTKAAERWLSRSLDET